MTVQAGAASASLLRLRMRLVVLAPVALRSLFALRLLRHRLRSLPSVHRILLGRRSTTDRSPLSTKRSRARSGTPNRRRQKANRGGARRCRAHRRDLATSTIPSAANAEEASVASSGPAQASASCDARPSSASARECGGQTFRAASTACPSSSDAWWSSRSENEFEPIGALL